MPAAAAHDGDASLGPVRPQHRIDEKQLAAFLATALPNYAPPLTVLQYGGGQSNPTFLLKTGRGDYVLRKKPPGELTPSAHAIDREYRIQRALRGSAVPVVRTRCYCDDSGVIGSPFYLMDHLKGRVFRDPRLLDLAPDERAAIYSAMGACLAALHSIDPAAVDLADFGRGEGYFARQVDRAMRQYRAAATDASPPMEELAAWLPRHLPDNVETTIVHGDFRMENLVFHPVEPRIIGVLDWELATLGHPLADLAHNCLIYHIYVVTQPGFTEGRPSGIPAESDYVATYMRATGRRISSEDWRFALAFALFRLASICAGVYRRGVDGNASSVTAMRFLEITDSCARAGAAQLSA